MFSNAKTVELSVPNTLPAPEVQRRIDKRVKKLADKYSPNMQLVEYVWDGAVLISKVTAKGQTVDGRIEILDDKVEVNVQIPLLAFLFKDKIKARLEKELARVLTA